MTTSTDERPKCLVSMTEEEAKNFTPATEEEILAALEKGRREANAMFPWPGMNPAEWNPRVETGRTSTKERNESNRPRAEREENAALRVHYEQIVAQANIECSDASAKGHRLEAALGRALAAIEQVLNYCPFCRPKETKCRAHYHIQMRAVLADPEGRAAGEYVGALEREHAALTLTYLPASIIERDAQWEELRLAHAAVEMLRGGK